MDIDVLKPCVEAQIEEYEMLSSVFCKENELRCYDPGILPEMRDFLDGKTSEPPPALEFVISVTVGDGSSKPWELSVTFPAVYPLKAQADVFVRCPDLTREQQHRLNADLQTYLDEVYAEDPYIYSAVVWLQDHSNDYICASDARSSKESSENPDESRVQDEKLARFWIYSHHIYNKMKRREILDTAGELRLNGFSLPGKPGIICVEGYRSDCAEFWSRIRSLNWQKIVLKNEEEIAERKFDVFQELCFDGGKKFARSYRMDMGDFSKYLEAHGCGYAFKDYFGFDPSSKGDAK